MSSSTQSAAQEPKGCLFGFLSLLGLGSTRTQSTVDNTLEAGGVAPPLEAAPEYPYVLRHDFVSNAELSFYRVLRTVVDEETTILLKVGLADLFFVPSSDRSDYRVFMNRIDRKHVDFVLCDAASLTPRVAIELDDRSHARPDRQVRDELVNEVFAAAGLPLLRIPVQTGYARTELAARLRFHVKTINASDSPAAVAQPVNQPSSSAPRPESASVSGTAPTCPHCGREMILRTARSGPNQGKPFWGCPNYPRCKTMLAVATNGS